MQISEVDAFNQLLDTAAIVFGKKLTEEVKRAYFDALKPLPLSIVRENAAKHLANAKFFPKPVDLKPKFTAEAAGRDTDSKYPPLYSPAWWEGRVQILKHTAPKGLSVKSRESLDEATFGKDDCAELRAQAHAAYAKAWPWMELDDRRDEFLS